MKLNFDLDALKTPCYVVDKALLVKNLEVLKRVSDITGARILLAQKAFSMFSLYPLIGKYLSGTAASGLFEAKLGFEEMGKENHIYSPAYLDSEFDEIISICDHIVFNSFSQWTKFRNKALSSNVKCGIRINPECSTQDHAIYDPCTACSRLGVTIDNFREDELDGITGLHFHTLCEQNSADLKKTLKAVEEKFGKYLYKMEWINLGGGHHITRPDYDMDMLISCIEKFRDKYNLQVYLEPGEAVVLYTGFLVSTVLETLNNDIDIAILDTSAACHMPDVLEMPYRPNIISGGKPNQKAHTYRLGGPTCLAGDIVGDYSFDRPLKPGDKLVFCDMAHYTMVKNNTFNGMKLPSIYIADENGVHLVKEFGYTDFKKRLS